MIALLLAPLLVQAAPGTLPAAPPVSGPAPVLGAIGRQELPASGCAAFLWSTGPTPVLIAMVGAAPARIRLAIDGRPPADLTWTAGEGSATLGFAPRATYRGDGVTATLSLTVATRSDLSDGAAVPEGAVTLEMPGRDAVVVPVAGLIGCRN